MSEAIRKLEPERQAEPGYVVIRQEDAVKFSRQVRELTAALLMLQREVEAMKQDNSRRATVNHQQAKALGLRIRERAEEICGKYQLEPRAHAAAFRAAIKKSVLNGCGVQDLHDIPLGDYEFIAQQIDSWSSFALVRKRRGIDAAMTKEDDHGRVD